MDYVFRLFLKKRFLYQRDDTDYRMQNITNALGISNRLITCGRKELPRNFSKINYSEVRDRLAKLRIKSEEFIDNNIVNL